MSTRTQQLSDDELRTFCDALLTGGADGAAKMANIMLCNGRTQRSLYQNVLGSAARQLGDMWDKDEVSFVGVHTAMFRIETIIRETAKRYTRKSRPQDKRAIFATVPGDEHITGLKIATEVQRSKGWEIRQVLRPTHDELLSIVAGSDAEIIGLSIGSSSSMSKLYRLVRVLRVYHPNMKILICGSLVAEDHEPFLQLGVDACASSLGRSVELLEKMSEEISAAN